MPTLHVPVSFEPVCCKIVNIVRLVVTKCTKMIVIEHLGTRISLHRTDLLHSLVC